MARNYPRFLYSNPLTTKSKGPFIVHLIEPRLVFKISKDFDEFEKSDFAAGFSVGGPNTDFFIILLDNPPNELETIAYQKIILAAGDWVVGQVKSHQIELFAKPYTITFNAPELVKGYLKKR